MATEIYQTPIYCSVCGQKLISGALVRYNVINGASTTGLRCPQDHEKWTKIPYTDAADDAWELLSTTFGVVA